MVVGSPDMGEAVTALVEVSKLLFITKIINLRPEQQSLLQSNFHQACREDQQGVHHLQEHRRHQGVRQGVLVQEGDLHQV